MAEGKEIVIGRLHIGYWNSHTEYVIERGRDYSLAAFGKLYVYYG